jgi:four helix bundle protein
MSTYKDLAVWQQSVEFAVHVYQSTEAFPNAERLGLTAQLRRAAVSIASNVAEGHGRRSARELVRFLYDARGSAFEVETQLVIARRIGLLGDDEFRSVSEELSRVIRLLDGTIRYAKSKIDSK